MLWFYCFSVRLSKLIIKNYIYTIGFASICTNSSVKDGGVKTNIMFLFSYGFREKLLI